MAVKRRVDKRRIDPEALASAWRELLESGYDFFGDLPANAGIQLGEHGQPDREQARAAWAHYGPGMVADRGPGRLFWAEEQFGRPWEAARCFARAATVPARSAIWIRRPAPILPKRSRLAGAKFVAGPDGKSRPMTR